MWTRLRGRAKQLVEQGRYPYISRRRMLHALGPDLAAEVTWTAEDGPLDGELASVFGSTDSIHKWAHYLPVYESALAEFRTRPIKMLEIGVFRGGSLRMWRKYLHPDSVIVGIDIDPNTKQYDNPAQGMHVRIGGQQDIPFLQSVVKEFGTFDVILDDGSHMTSHMVDTFRYLFPNALADGGVYIVEDIHSNYWRSFRDTPTTFFDFTKQLIDAMHAHYPGATHEEQSFRVDHPDRLREVRVPVAAAILEKMEIHDSIALYYRAKGRRPLPRSILRPAAAAHAATPE